MITIGLGLIVLIQCYIIYSQAKDRLKLQLRISRALAAHESDAQFDAAGMARILDDEYLLGE